MKICPACGKQYSDESLNFCLDDGSALNFSGSGHNPPPQTVFVAPPSPTNPPGSFGTQPNFNQGLRIPAVSQNRKSAKSGVWVFAILGLLVFICGGGVIGFFIWAGMQDGGRTNDYNVSNPKTDPKKNVKTFNMNLWKQETNEYAKSEYKNGEFILETLKESYYYVFVTLADFKTQNATARLTVKNINSKQTNYGYGILFHSSTTPLVTGYAFLIDSEKQSFRVAKHLFKTESEIQDWKYFAAIKKGSAPNVLEVRDEGDTIKFFINNQLATSVEDELDDDNGISGIYGSNAPIAYTNLELQK